MQKIAPFKNYEEALSILDNGGRFYNILSKEDNGIITQSEISKVSGLFYDKQQLILYFEMATANLKTDNKELIVSKLSRRLQKIYAKYKPVYINNFDGFNSEYSQNYILRGKLSKIEHDGNFQGFINLAHSANKVNSFAQIPVTEFYTLYHFIIDNESMLVAHPKEDGDLDNTTLTLGCMKKEMRKEKFETYPSMKYLEILYYSE